MQSIVDVKETNKLIIINDVLWEQKIPGGKKLWMIKASNKNRIENTTKNNVAQKNFIKAKRLSFITNRE